MSARRTLLAGFLALCAGAGIAHAQPYRPIPELRHEEIPPPPPGRRVVWEPGHWRWDGREYDWVRGHYIDYHPHYGHYVHGHWAQRGPGWVWVEPHWE